MIGRLFSRLGLGREGRFMREHRWTHAHLSDYLDEDITSGGRRRVEEHVGVCPECRRVLATLRRTLAGLRGLRDAPAAGRGAGEEQVADRVIDRLRSEG